MRCFSVCYPWKICCLCFSHACSGAVQIHTPWKTSMHVQEKTTTADRGKLRVLCSSPVELFKKQLCPWNRHTPPRAVGSDNGTSPAAPTPVQMDATSKSSNTLCSGTVGEQKERRKVAETDKLAAAVIGRVLPYVCNTCMRCNKQAVATLTECVLSFQLL